MPRAPRQKTTSKTAAAKAATATPASKTGMKGRSHANKTHLTQAAAAPPVKKPTYSQPKKALGLRTNIAPSPPPIPAPRGTIAPSPALVPPPQPTRRAIASTTQKASASPTVVRNKGQTLHQLPSPVAEEDDEGDCYSPFLDVRNPEPDQYEDDTGIRDSSPEVSPEALYPNPDEPLELSGESLADFVHWERDGFEDILTLNHPTQRTAAVLRITACISHMNFFMVADGGFRADRMYPWQARLGAAIAMTKARGTLFLEPPPLDVYPESHTLWSHYLTELRAIQQRAYTSGTPTGFIVFEGNLHEKHGFRLGHHFFTVSPLSMHISSRYQLTVSLLEGER